MRRSRQNSETEGRHIYIFSFSNHSLFFSGVASKPRESLDLLGWEVAPEPSLPLLLLQFARDPMPVTAEKCGRMSHVTFGECHGIHGADPEDRKGNGRRGAGGCRGGRAGP